MLIHRKIALQTPKLKKGIFFLFMFLFHKNILKFRTIQLFIWTGIQDIIKIINIHCQRMQCNVQSSVKFAIQNTVYWATFDAFYTYLVLNNIQNTFYYFGDMLLIFPDHYNKMWIEKICVYLNETHLPKNLHISVNTSRQPKAIGRWRRSTDCCTLVAGGRADDM